MTTLAAVAYVVSAMLVILSVFVAIELLRYGKMIRLYRSEVAWLKDEIHRLAGETATWEKVSELADLNAKALQHIGGHDANFSGRISDDVRRDMRKADHLKDVIRHNAGGKIPA